MDNFMENIELIKYIATFVAGLCSGYTLSIKINKQKISSSNITQNNNRVTGGQAGRDINNNKKR
jgi:hypothetical protein